MAPCQRKNGADAAAINETLLDYVEGRYEGNAARMQLALYPELAKRIVRKNSKAGKDYLEKMTAEELVTGTGTDGGCAADSTVSRPKCTLIPKEKQQKDITIFAIYEDEASSHGRGHSQKRARVSRTEGDTRRGVARLARVRLDTYIRLGLGELPNGIA